MGVSSIESCGIVHPLRLSVARIRYLGATGPVPVVRIQAGDFLASQSVLHFLLPFCGLGYKGLVDAWRSTYLITPWPHPT